MTIWGIFLNATRQAGVHLGQYFEANLLCVKNHFWNSVGQLFNETGKLISEQKEITGVSTKAYRITHAKACVFSDSVLCVGRMGDDPIATWKSKKKRYSENNHFKDMISSRSPTEFDQNNHDVTSIPGYVSKKNSSRGKTKECTTQRNRCLKRHVRESTDAILQCYQGGTPTKNTESHYRPPGGENTTKCCTTELPWRSTSTSLQELKEFKIRSIGFSRYMQKDLSNHSINDLTLLKRKENANDCTTSTWQGPSKTTEPSLAVNK